MLYEKGERVLVACWLHQELSNYSDTAAEVLEVKEDTEEYVIETYDGNILTVEEDDLMPYSVPLFNWWGD